MKGNQLSLLDLYHPPVQAPVPSPDGDTYGFLLKYWTNSQDLAFCMVNVLLHTNELLFEFVEYIKNCRLSGVSAEVPRPSPQKLFDRLAECLGKMEFSRLDRGEGGEVIRTETTVLDFAIDVSFDEKELGDLRAFGVAGASTQEVEGLAEAIRNFVEEDNASDTDDDLPQIDKSNVCHPYIAMLRRLGIPEEAMPNQDDKDAVLKALLDGIDENEEWLDWVLSETDITKRDLLAAGSHAERERLRKALAKALSHALAGFYGTQEWHRHRCFSPLPILLTDGALYLAENGGGSGPSAFWLMDAIASYQGEKKLARHPFQTWRLIVTPEYEGRSRSAVLICGDNIEKPIVRQEIGFTDFLLDGETMLYASREEHEPGRKCLIILLPSEY